MKIAIMQPYFLPYLGYFQLISAVDKFIIFDNDYFKKGGWINRNRLRNNVDFVIPLKKSSQNKLIKDTEINWDDKLIEKFFKSVKHLYSSSPNYPTVDLILNNLFSDRPKTISELSIASIIEFSKYLKLNTQFKIASEENYDKGKDRVQSLIKICKAENALVYINAIGGRSLYSNSDFKSDGVKLFFINTLMNRSILDYCFTMNKKMIRQEINNFKLIEAD